MALGSEEESLGGSRVEWAGVSAPTAPPLLLASPSVEVAAVKAQALVPTLILFVHRHRHLPAPANRANPLPAEHSQYRGLVGGHLSLSSDPMSGHPKPATAASN